MKKDIKFPDQHARRESATWFPVILGNKEISCTITDKFIDEYLRGDSLTSDEEIYTSNIEIIKELVKYKIINNLYNKDGSITITSDYDSGLLEIIKKYK